MLGEDIKIVKYYYFSVVMRTPLALTCKICAEIIKGENNFKISAEIIKRWMVKGNMFVASNIFPLLISHSFSFAHKDEHTRLSKVVCEYINKNITGLHQ